VAIEDWTSGIYSLTEREGALRMYLRKEKISERANCAYLGVRQKSYRFVAETGMEFYPENESETAGLVLYQNNENHLRFEVVRVDGEVCFVVTSCIHGDEQTLATTRLEKKGKLKIRLQCRNQCARVWISEGKGYVSVAENLDLLAYTTEEAGGFVGCTVGVYASSNGSDSTNYADFEWLTCQSMD
jgi:alpha-N-arabinofuranosidase